jgi:hypothetical protein
MTAMDPAARLCRQPRANANRAAAVRGRATAAHFTKQESSRGPLSQHQSFRSRTGEPRTWRAERCS